MDGGGCQASSSSVGLVRQRLSYYTKRAVRVDQTLTRKTPMGMSTKRTFTKRVAPWLLIATLTLSACAERSVLFYSPLSQTLVPLPLGRALDAATIQLALGAPESVRLDDDGRAHWEYVWRFSGLLWQEHLEVVFDRDGRFLEYSRSRLAGSQESQDREKRF